MWRSSLHRVARWLVGGSVLVAGAAAAVARPGRIDDRPRAHDHERSDVSAVAVTAVGLGLVLFLVIALIVLSWLYAHFTGYPVTVRPPTGGVADIGHPAITPAPRLEADIARDLQTLRAEETHTLTTYGWVDRKAGTVRVPIDRAMEILARRGLPSRPGPPPFEHEVAAGSASGRFVLRREE